MHATHRQPSTHLEIRPDSMLQPGHIHPVMYISTTATPANIHLCYQTTDTLRIHTNWLP